MTLVAGVDSSTQRCKVVIVNLASGAVVRSGSAPHPPGTEVDPEAWWVALQAAIAEAGGLADVAAIAVGGQQHGMVALDTSGAVIRPALLWNDTRSAPDAAALIARFGRAELVRRTGLSPVASFTSTKLAWLARAESAAAKQVAAVALPHDWLTWRLRGFGPEHPDLHALVTDRSDASGTGYWSPSDNTYDRELLTAALGHDAILPRLLGPSEPAGATIVLDGTTRDCVVGPGAGDNAAAALGLAADVGDAVISIGTSGTVFAVSPTRVTDPTGTVAGFADAAGGFLPLVCTLNAARVLDAIAALLGVDHATLGALALTTPAGAGGLVLQPYFEGERTPDLPHATGTLFGLTLTTTTPAHLARAAIEGVLCGLADGLDAITTLGCATRRLLLIGGAARNEGVARIAAEVFDVPVVVPEPGEYVALGAAVQAAWTLTGTRPPWQPMSWSTPEPATEPAIRARYTIHVPPA